MKKHWPSKSKDRSLSLLRGAILMLKEYFRIIIEVCPACHGNGVGSIGICQICNSSGYPRGYVPPTYEQCLKHSFPDEWKKKYGLAIDT